jgi:hypothetical protein
MRRSHPQSAGRSWSVNLPCSKHGGIVALGYTRPGCLAPDGRDLFGPVGCWRAAARSTVSGLLGVATAHLITHQGSPGLRFGACPAPIARRPRSPDSHTVSRDLLIRRRPCFDCRTAAARLHMACTCMSLRQMNGRSAGILRRCRRPQAAGPFLAGGGRGCLPHFGEPMTRWFLHSANR